ncbi:hypothetical protein [Erythrobacter sp.]|jgi:hypothetical protein|uniref:hypothetical protein n=1 Tax=Erythrobacter sp. TaxID=1042 RepID=UPI002EAA50BD|nr:hypothetical protein [Erythrobacter sp.]
MALFLLLIIGGLTGWFGSIALRVEAAGAILKMMGVGMATALVAGLIANGGTFLGSLSWLAAGIGLVAAIAAVIGAYVFLTRDIAV